MANNKVQLADGSVLIDLTNDTVTANTLKAGYTAHDASGNIITGTMDTSATGVVLTGEINQNGGKTLYINGIANEALSSAASGGTIDDITGTVLLDLSDDTVYVDVLKAGFTAHDSMGRPITGALVVTEPVLGAKTISVNGTYSALDDELDGYSSVIIQVPTEGGSTPLLQEKSVTPSEIAQTIIPDSGYDGLSSVLVGAISSTYVGTGIARKSSSDLTSSGATVSVPSGYYAEAGSKSVPSGSASTPATSITANPSISINSAGLITATVSASKSITPSVSAGYVSSGTAGNVGVSGSNTEQLPTQESATITPTTSSQTVGGAGKYMTGAITVNPIPSNYITTSDATASADDILSGETAYVNGSKLTGTLVIQHYYTGTTDPSSSIGSNGDIYLKTGA